MARILWGKDEVDVIVREYPSKGPHYCLEKLPGRSLRAIHSKAVELKIKTDYVEGEWAPDQIEILREHYPAVGAAGCQGLLPGRSLRAIRSKASVLGIGYRGLKSVWTDDEINTLRMHYPQEGAVGCLKRLSGRTHRAVAHKAQQMGLKMTVSDEPALTVVNALWHVEKGSKRHKKISQDTLSDVFWTTSEEAILKEHYPTHGTRYCMKLLPGRSADAIYAKAKLLDLKGAPRSVKGRRRYPESSGVDAEIRHAYSTLKQPRKGFVRELAARVGRPEQWVRKRAHAMGLTAIRLKEPKWSEEEERLLATLVREGLNPKQIRGAMLREGGYRRSLGAIVQRVSRRLGLGFENDPEETGRYNLGQVATLMGVARTTVERWILKHGLVAKHASGDVAWEVKRESLRRWIIDNPMNIDLCKVDKFWFIELVGRG